MSTVVPVVEDEDQAHSSKTPYTVADVFLQALAEFTAISAADGYARLTNKPQCVIVHVDVGTAALGQGVHNASSGRSPMLIFAGVAPYTLHGEVSGSRTEHVQWYQDVPRQEAIVEPYVRYSNEIKTAENVKCIVNRAMLMASSGSPGPSYLTASREVLAAVCKESAMTSRPPILPQCRVGGLPPDAIPMIADALLSAEKPLVITGYLGRNHAAVHALINLANLLPTLLVLDTEFRTMSFPADHPAWITRTTGGPQALREADVILVLDCDVPWIPTKARPKDAARVFHVDVDPRKEKMQLFDIHAEVSFMAECEIALEQLIAHITSHEDFPSQTQDRAQQRLETHNLALSCLARLALPHPDGRIPPPHLFTTLRALLPQQTTYLHDAVTLTTPLHGHLQSTLPGTSFSKGGSGLGWAPGAAIGARLARPTAFICAITADGAYLLSSPTPTYLSACRLRTPFLTIILNNRGWKAPRQSINDVHPDGLAAGMSDGEIGFELEEGVPDYVGVCKAATGGWCWGRRVVGAGELEGAVREAAEVVRGEGRGAVLEVVVS
ncbi:hypothetical protein PRZ48_007087 [Zasmidium cellare]|uniref:Pyruvate decarboxylase n=1 Tax=Zasmidium cellare TaxID=395010 RepID=A0ABR0EJ89_ZASCE|nr:hypothetical protein PRZ48_007087 [Zasmidium cellare]